MKEAILSEFFDRHILLSEEWLNAVVQHIRAFNAAPNGSSLEIWTGLVLEQFIHSNLADSLSVHALSQFNYDKNVGRMQMPSPSVFQIVSMKDIRRSLYSQTNPKIETEDQTGFEKIFDTDTEEELNKPTRVLEFELSDGSTIVKAFEFSPLPYLDSDFSPGSKVLLFPPLLCRNGIFFLTRENFNLIGTPSPLEDLLDERAEMPAILENDEELAADEMPPDVPDVLDSHTRNHRSTIASSFNDAISLTRRNNDEEMSEVEAAELATATIEANLSSPTLTPRCNRAPLQELQSTVSLSSSRSVPSTTSTPASFEMHSARGGQQLGIDTTRLSSSSNGSTALSISSDLQHRFHITKIEPFSTSQPSTSVSSKRAARNSLREVEREPTNESAQQSAVTAEYAKKKVKIELIELDDDEEEAVDVKPTIVKLPPRVQSSSSSSKGIGSLEEVQMKMATTDGEFKMLVQAKINDIIVPLRIVEGKWCMQVSLKDESTKVSLVCDMSAELLVHLIGISPKEAIEIRRSSDAAKRAEGERKINELKEKMKQPNLLLQLECDSNATTTPLIKSLMPLF